MEGCQQRLSHVSRCGGAGPASAREGFLGRVCPQGNDDVGQR